MDVDKFKEIKEELILKVEELLKRYKTRNAEGLDGVRVLIDHLNSFDEYCKSIIDILNGIIASHDISFKSDSDKNDFISALRPTIEELRRKHPRN